MTFFWLASYPKSGNTWFRMLLSNLDATEPADINALTERATIASARGPFDDITLTESAELYPSEIEQLRTGVYRTIALGEYRDGSGNFRKVHDAYAEAFGVARGAVVVVRDPRAIAPSLAHHFGRSIDRAIAMMASDEAFLGGGYGPGSQLRQSLRNWSAHVASWLEQRDLPVFLLRYEELKAEAPMAFARALAFCGRHVSAVDARNAALFSHFDVLQAQETAQGFRERAATAPFFRRGEAESWRDELSAGQIERIETRHGAMMRRLGYALVSEGCVA